MGVQSIDVPLAGDRVLDVLLGGVAEGPALVCHHGTPTDATFWSDWSDIATENGVRLIAISRPGYATSTRRPGRNVASVADDVRAIRDHFAGPWCVPIGHSGGGPHALATAALVGDRTRSVATLAGVAPYDAEGLDFFDGMGPENLDEFGEALKGEAHLRTWMDANAVALRTVTPGEVSDALGGLIADVDRDALAAGLAERVASATRRALARSFDGWIDDDLAFANPWGFALDRIAIPVTTWQGDLDLMVPRSHGEWLAGHIPHARARMLAGQGHLSIMGLRAAIVADLLEGARSFTPIQSP